MPEFIMIQRLILIIIINDLVIGSCLVSKVRLKSIKCF